MRISKMVYIELLRRGKEIYYHSGKNECDFLIKEGIKITEAIQVTWTVNKTNIQRETSGLQEAIRIHNLEQGLLLTTDAEETEIMTDNSIKIIPVWKWLLTK